MKKKTVSKSDNKKSFIVSAVIVIIVIVAITIIAAFLFVEQPPTENESILTDDSRIIDWRHVHGVGVDPADSSLLYIATHGDFYQSRNGAPPVKVDKVRADYMAFNAPPTKDSPLYASGHPSSGGNTGLIKSTDGGVTWQQVATILEPPVDFHAMAVTKSNPDMILGFDSGGRGLFQTTDAGKTWNSIEYPEYISALAISPNDSQLIFAGTAKGIFKSSDGGKTWSHLETYKGLTVYALAFDDEDTLIASAGNFGLVRSSDLGESWEDLQDIDLTVTSIATDLQNKLIYVGGFSPGGFQEVYKIPYDMSSYEMIATNRGLK